METQYKITFIESGFRMEQFIETLEDAQLIYNGYLTDETKSDITFEETTEYPKHPTIQ